GGPGVVGRQPEAGVGEGLLVVDGEALDACAAAVVRASHAVVAHAAGIAAVRADQVGPGRRVVVLDGVVVAFGPRRLQDVVQYVLEDHRTGQYRLGCEIPFGGHVEVVRLVRVDFRIAAAAGSHGVIEESLV